MANIIEILIKARDETAEACSSAQDAIGGLQSTIANNSKKIGTAMVATGAGITAAMGMSVKSTGDFEQALKNAVSVTGYSGEEADIAQAKMEDLARTLGRETRYSATEVAVAMYDLASKGFKPAEMAVEDLLPFLNIAAATQSDLGMSTEIVTAALRSFGLQESEAGRISDVFAKTIGSSAATLDKLGLSLNYVGPVARAAGLSVEETSAFLGALYNTGLDASMAGTALRGVLTELMSPSTDLTKASERLGLSLEDISLESHSLSEILATLQARGITNAEIMDIFGKRAGPAALSLLSVNDAGETCIDTIGILQKTLESAGGSAAAMAEVQLNTLQGQTLLARSAFQELVLTLGTALLPIITNLIERITSLLLPLGEWMERNPVLTKGLTIATAAIGLLLIPLGSLLILLPKLQAGWASLTGILHGFTTVANGMIGMIPKLVAGLVTLSKGLISVGAAGFKAVAGLVASSAAKIWSWASTIPIVGVGMGIAAVAALTASILAIKAKVSGFAQGGIIKKPTLGLIGEAGPEAIVPLKGLGKRNAGVVVNNTISLNVGTLTGDRESAEKLLDIIQEGLRTRQRYSLGEALY